MRYLAAAIALATLIVSCATAATSAKKAFTVVAQGAYGSREGREPLVAVASNATTYSALWNTLGGSADAPAVDLSKNSVVFLSMGKKHSGGYSIDVQDVRLDGKRATVRAKLVTPGRRSPATQALTSPFCVISVAKRGVSHVRWVNPADGALIAETPAK